MKRLVLLIMFMLLATPVSANEDEFIDWTGISNYGNGWYVKVGINKYSGDVIYTSNTHSLQVIPRNK